MDLRLKYKMNNETFRRKYSWNVHDLGLGEVFLDLVTKSTIRKRKKMINWTLLKWKPFAFSKTLGEWKATD